MDLLQSMRKEEGRVEVRTWGFIYPQVTREFTAIWEMNADSNSDA